MAAFAISALLASSVTNSPDSIDSNVYDVPYSFKAVILSATKFFEFIRTVWFLKETLRIDLASILAMLLVYLNHL
jgi:hypothetical protein